MHVRVAAAALLALSAACQSKVKEQEGHPSPGTRATATAQSKPQTKLTLPMDCLEWVDKTEACIKKLDSTEADKIRRSYIVQKDAFETAAEDPNSIGRVIGACKSELANLAKAHPECR